MKRSDLPTPALILDLPAMRRNIERMAIHAASVGVGLRPHAKSHKSVEIARMLVEAGALGACCATIREPRPWPKRTSPASWSRRR
jgi:3-hydroxy-D-aspartate aldolase